MATSAALSPRLSVGPAAEASAFATGSFNFWADAANWSAGIPDSQTTATIGNGGSVQIETAAEGPYAALASSLLISRGSVTEPNNSSLAVGTLTLTGGLAGGGNASLSVAGHSTVTADAVTLGGTGTLFRAALTLGESALFTASSVTLRATGSPAVEDSSSRLEFLVSETATFSAGSLTLQADQTAGFGSVIFGVSSPNAVVTGNVALIGINSPTTETTEIRIDSLGNSTGRLAIGGSLSVSGSGSFFLGLPSDPAAAPAFDITGSFDISSLASAPFKVDLQSSNYPGIPDGYSWKFLEADGGVSGNLDGLVMGYAGNDPKWHLVHDATSLSLVYSAVPEPSTLTQLICALVAGMWAARRSARSRQKL